MRAAVPLLCAGLLLAGCANPTPPPDTARVVPGEFGGNGDPDITAANLAQWAFSAPSRTANDPADAARAIASVDYLAGALSTSPRWSGIGPLVKQQMLQARVEVRQAIGVAPGAPSQIVVSSLAHAAYALAANDPRAASAAVSNPAFTRPGEQTVAMLYHLPFLPLANIASQRAAVQMQNFGPCFSCL